MAMGDGRGDGTPDLELAWVSARGDGKREVSVRGGGKDNRCRRVMRWAVDRGIGHRTCKLWEARDRAG